MWTTALYAETAKKTSRNTMQQSRDKMEAYLFEESVTGEISRYLESAEAYSL
ncbi:MAG: hypothetical protein ACLUD2_13885 [Clostridium sp.]